MPAQGRGRGRGQSRVGTARKHALLAVQRPRAPPQDELKRPATLPVRQPEPEPKPQGSEQACEAARAPKPWPQSGTGASPSACPAPPCHHCRWAYRVGGQEPHYVLPHVGRQLLWAHVE